MRRIIRAAKKRGRFESRICARAIGGGRTDHENVIGVAARVFHAEIFVFHFNTYLQLLAREDNWCHYALSESDFAAAITGIFLFEKAV